MRSLQTGREFFKEASGKALPILGMAAWNNHAGGFGLLENSKHSVKYTLQKL